MPVGVRQCVTVLWLLVLLAGCGGSVVKAPVGVRGTPDSGWHPKYHTVKRGESLYSVAWKYGYDYQKLARINGIRPPYTIYTGQKLRLSAATPATSSKSSAAVSLPKSTGKNQDKTKENNIKLKSTSTTGTAYRAPDRYDYPGTVQGWQWPVKGTILRRFDPNSQGKKGIAIGGRRGTKIHAAAAGRVVYSGSGLVGYGRLIIVKHNDNYLSAYGHNDKLLVKEGEVVKAGQVLAYMGSSGTNRTMLHFEIRRNGKPVDPLRYLPRR